jgi:glutathione synthase/RimK-type ligase-like ATP-grasp enzyme
VAVKAVILILANKWDLTVDLVVLELQRRGVSFVRLNTEDLPTWTTSVHFPGADLCLSSSSGRRFSSGDVSAIWNRRPGHVYDDVPQAERPTPGIQKFVMEQWFAWLQGLQLEPDVRWINHPVNNALMENKLRQLKLAHELGFAVPETLITNSYTELVRWRNGIRSEFVCKALYAPLIEDSEKDHFIFTNMLPEGDLSEFAARLELAPVIFQRAITPKRDYRVTVVGTQVFAVEIEGGVTIDWRIQKEGLRFSSCKLPREVESRCVDYVQQAGLMFGAIDLVSDGATYYFLEVNPNGEWGWLQRPHGIPIAPALCDLLTGVCT